jgi:hypothetical protein
MIPLADRDGVLNSCLLARFLIRLNEREPSTHLKKVEPAKAPIELKAFRKMIKAGRWV